MKKLLIRILDLFRSKRDPRTKGKKLINIVGLSTGILCEHWKAHGDPSTYVRVINYKNKGYECR